MCLVKIHDGYKISDNDIECYKILRALVYANVYETPFRHHLCNIGVTIYSLDTNGANQQYIDVEGVHAYVDKNVARKHKEKMESYPGETDLVLTLCKIPANTKYYLGTKGDIASEEMKIVKIIDLLCVL